MSTELDFVSKFVHLVDVSSPSAASQQEIIEGWKVNNIDTLTKFSFPYLKEVHFYNNNGTEEAMDVDMDEDDDSLVEVSFKSLRAPKFNKLLNIPVNKSTSIFDLKTKLSSLLRDEESMVVNIADVKLMIRAKSLGDAEKVHSVLESNGLEKLALNVLISKFKPVESESEANTEPIKNTVNVPSISETSWMKIAEILQNDLNDSLKVNELLSKFKALV